MVNEVMKKKIMISILTIGLFNLANCEKIENVHAEEEVNKVSKEIVQVDLEKSKEIHERLQKLKVIEIEEKEYIEFKLTYYSSDPSENIPGTASVTCEGKNL